MRTAVRRLARVAARLHKWVALVVGLQILVWFATGLFMSAVPIERVRGEHLKAAAPPPAIEPQDLAAALSRLPKGTVQRMEVRDLLGRPAILLVPGEGRPVLYDPDGNRLSPLGPAMAMRLAAADFAGAGRPLDATAVTVETTEYRGPLPAWRVRFDDPEQTVLFVSADEGRVVTRRTDLWRLYDFLWGLHIMDWKNHADTNAPWLTAASALALLVALSGAVLIPFRLGWLRRRPSSG